MADLLFSCSCGAIAGALVDVGPQAGDRYVCYCNDCRDFMRYLDRDDALDPAGGTSVYQTRIDHLRVDKGIDHIACVNLTGKQTLRWFCGECRTPLFNTMDKGSWPFLSTITVSCDPHRREAVLGPPRGSVFAKFATSIEVVKPPVSAFTMMRRVLLRLFADKLSGASKRFVLFDPKSNAPIAAPRQLTETEKQALGRQ